VEERARSFDLALATDEHRGLHREVVPNAAERAQGGEVGGEARGQQLEDPLR
jgi:hypothetical protein